MSLEITLPHIREFFPGSSSETQASSSLSSKCMGVFKDMAFVARSTWTYWEGEWGNSIKEAENSQGLAVFIHGLGGQPRAFSYQRDLTESSCPDVSIYQPIVLALGNCSLAEAAAPIHRTVLAWSKIYPHKPIVFAGTSNGARISAYVISLLKKEGITNPIKLSAIAGPFHGTSLIGTCGSSSSSKISQLWRKGVSLLYSEDISKELALNSTRCNQVLNALQNSETAPDETDFYGTDADSKVLPISSAYPLNVPNARYFMVAGEGHSSIVEAVAIHQVSVISHFIHSHSLSAPSLETLDTLASGILEEKK
jgi:hypothetical protein